MYPRETADETPNQKDPDRAFYQGGGYFMLSFVNTELRLKLVRVHTEYLVNL